MSWKGNAQIDGMKNLVDVLDQVTMVSRQKDGTVNTATSKKMQATLVDRAATTQEAKAPRSPDEQQFMNDKDISAATLMGDVEVKSELAGPAGTLLRGMNLFAETVTY